LALNDILSNQYILAVILGLAVIALGILAFMAAKIISSYWKQYNKKRKANINLRKAREAKIIKAEKKANMIKHPKLKKNKLVDEDGMKAGKMYFEALESDYFKSKGMFRDWINNRKRKKDNLVMVKMQMADHRHKEYLVSGEVDKFLIKGSDGKKKMFAFDPEAAYPLQTSNIMAYDFHESISIPIKREIPENLIKEAMETGELTEVSTALNPNVLERLINSEIAQSVLQAASIGKALRILMILFVIALIVVTIDMFVDMWHSGALDSITASFRN